MIKKWEKRGIKTVQKIKKRGYKNSVENKKGGYKNSAEMWKFEKMWKIALRETNKM